MGRLAITSHSNHAGRWSMVSGGFKAGFNSTSMPWGHRTPGSNHLQPFKHGSNKSRIDSLQASVMTRGKACEALSQDFGIHVAGSLEDVNYTVPWPQRRCGSLVINKWDIPISPKLVALRVSAASGKHMFALEPTHFVNFHRLIIAASLVMMSFFA